MGIQTKKNFIKTNATETIMSVPKKPQPNYVDTRRGDKQLLDTSGLVPKFTNKKGLKKNWGELHHQYQGISVVTDTTPKKYRKERLETEMKQLEKDIDMIERHKTIYIANR
ncbi:UNVERIFIED_CONTAM: hypothetical protein FKN15_026728 [Acipenser sinensis]